MKIGQITIEDFNSDKDKNILENYSGITRLGIQGVPGLEFKINDGGPIVMGQYGIYELDLSNGLGVITSLRFTEYPKDATQKTIYIDIVYLSKQEGNA